MNQRSNNLGREQQNTFGRYLKDLRKKKWPKQKDAADALGMKPETLSRIEHGKIRAPDELLVWLSQQCEVPLEEILMKKYWPQLPLLTGIMKPTELITDLTKELLPKEQEEVIRYAAFLLLRRSTASRQGNSPRNERTGQYV